MIQKFTPADMSEVLSILQEYGVPTYFDRVVLSDGGAYISCYIEETEFVCICEGVCSPGSGHINKDGLAPTGVFVTTQAGAEQGFLLGYDNASGSFEIGTIYICDSCIVVTPKSYPQNFFMVCKDSNDSTAVFMITSLNSNYFANSNGITAGDDSTYELWAVSFTDTYIRHYSILLANSESVNGSYVCQPIATAGSTLRNVYLPTVRQFYEETEPFAAEIDGYAYLCGRGFVARDSAAVDANPGEEIDLSGFYTAKQMDVKLAAMQTEINATAEQAGEAKTAADNAQEDAAKNTASIASLTESVSGLQDTVDTLAANQILYAAPMQDASVEGRYMLFAEYVFPRVKNYESSDLTLLVRNRGVSNTAEDGILRVRLRYGKASAAFQYAQIYFAQNIGIDAAKFMLCCNAAVGTAQLYLDVNTTYAGYICKVLDMGTSETIVDLGAWTLCSPTTGQTELPTEADGWTTVTAAGTVTATVSE